MSYTYLYFLNLGTKTLEFNNHITVHPALLCFNHCIFSIQKNIKWHRKSIRESDQTFDSIMEILR